MGCIRIHKVSLFTYLGPLLLDEHKPSTTTRQRTLLWAALAIPPKLFPCSFSLSSVSRIQLLLGRPLAYPLSLWVPGQGLACRTGCWFPEGVSDPAPLPPQNLLCHWFLSRSLQQIFILDFLWLSDASKIGVKECLFSAALFLLYAMSHIHGGEYTSRWR